MENPSPPRGSVSVSGPVSPRCALFSGAATEDAAGGTRLFTLPDSGRPRPPRGGPPLPRSFDYSSMPSGPQPAEANKGSYSPAGIPNGTSPHLLPVRVPSGTLRADRWRGESAITSATGQGRGGRSLAQRRPDRYRGRRWLFYRLQLSRFGPALLRGVATSCGLTADAAGIQLLALNLIFTERQAV